MDYEEYKELLIQELATAQESGQPLGDFLGKHNTTIEMLELFEPDEPNTLAMEVKFTGHLCAGCGSAGFTLSRSLCLFNDHLSAKGIPGLQFICAPSYAGGKLIPESEARAVIANPGQAAAWTAAGIAGK